MKAVSVFAPATVANVACGFDIFGFALETPGDLVTVRFCDKPGVHIKRISGASGLPTEANKNTAGVAVLSFLEAIHSRQGIELEIEKKMPLGSGLGSSAASAAAALYAVNILFDAPYKTADLVPFAMQAEKAACGSAHADNVAPALLGGFVLIRSYQPLDIVSIPTNLSIHCTILHPKIEIKTEEARRILKKEITMQQHVTQSGNAAGLVVALLKEDWNLLSRSLQDVIVEPQRSALIPGFSDIKSAALAAGALGCSISGSGPSIFALSKSMAEADLIGKAMSNSCRKNDIDYDLYLSPLNTHGPKLV